MDRQRDLTFSLAAGTRVSSACLFDRAHSAILQRCSFGEPVMDNRIRKMGLLCITP